MKKLLFFNLSLLLKILLLALCYSPLLWRGAGGEAFAQNPNLNRTNHWYFGEQAGLDFSSGSPVAVTDGQMWVGGNPVSMSDTAGNLLFYSNRWKVWNKNHQVMPNGTGLIQWGSNGFSHALCVPQPANPNSYYIFYWEYTDNTVSDWNMVYTIIDMTLDGGLGDVVSKRNFLMNKPLDAPGATMHADGENIWIVTMKVETNSFYAYLLTDTGITTTPVISNTGKIGNDNILKIKFSPSGNKVATAHDWYQLFDFDNSTGAVSNPIVFDVPCSACLNGWTEPWGVAFSQDGQKVYFTVHYFDIVPKGGHAIYQVSIFGDSASTFNSKILLDTMSVNDTVTGSFNTKLGMPFGLQLAKDGKIYVARNSLPVVGVINNPNADGLSSNYVDSVIDLQGRNAAFGFPSFVSNWFYDSSLVTTTTLPETDKKIMVYPNPFTTSTTIVLPFTGEVIMALYDVTGKQQKITASLTVTSGKTTVELKRNRLPAGIYILRIHHKDSVYSHKLVVSD